MDEGPHYRLRKVALTGISGEYRARVISIHRADSPLLLGEGLGRGHITPPSPAHTKILGFCLLNRASMRAILISTMQPNRTKISDEAPMTELPTQNKFQPWKQSLAGGLLSALIVGISMIVTTMAFPSGAYGPLGSFLYSIGVGFVLIPRLIFGVLGILGISMGGGLFAGIFITVLLWFVIGVILTRFSKSNKRAVGIWASLYLLCVLFTFILLVFAQL